MSHLISRILLAILLFPLAALFYLVAFAALDRFYRSQGWSAREDDVLILAAGATWIFLAGYWFLLWRGSVRFHGGRIIRTLVAAIAAAGAGVLIGFALHGVDPDVSRFVGSSAAPLLWLTATCFIWRESREERAARLDGGRESIVCPACGYNLTGLSATRCPECGKQYTLDELLGSQPSRAGQELQRAD